MSPRIDQSFFCFLWFFLSEKRSGWFPQQTEDSTEQMWWKMLRSLQFFRGFLILLMVALLQRLTKLPLPHVPYKLSHLAKTSGGNICWTVGKQKVSGERQSRVQLVVTIGQPTYSTPSVLLLHRKRLYRNWNWLQLWRRWEVLAAYRPL